MTTQTKFSDWFRTTSQIVGAPVVIAMGLTVTVLCGLGGQHVICKVGGVGCTKYAVADDLAGALHELDRQGATFDLSSSLKPKQKK